MNTKSKDTRIRVLFVPNPAYKNPSVYVSSLAHFMSYFKKYVSIVKIKQHFKVNMFLTSMLSIYYYALLHSDIIHIHWPEIMLGINKFGNKLLDKYKKVFRFGLWFLLFNLLKLLNKKIVITHHNIIPHSGKLHKFDWRLIYRFMKNADTIIVLNQYSKHFHCMLYGENICAKTIVIPHHHLDEFLGKKPSKQFARNMLGLPEDKFLVLILGTIKDYKNPELLVEIINSVCKQNKKIKFIIVGKQTDKFVNMLKSIENFSECILLRNKFVPDRELLLYLAASDLSIVTYKHIWGSATLNLLISYKLPLLVSPLPPILEELNNRSSDLCISDVRDAVHKINLFSLDYSHYMKFKEFYEKIINKVLTEKNPYLIAKTHIILYYKLLTKG